MAGKAGPKERLLELYTKMDSNIKGALERWRAYTTARTRERVCNHMQDNLTICESDRNDLAEHAEGGVKARRQ